MSTAFNSFDASALGARVQSAVDGNAFGSGGAGDLFWAVADATAAIRVLIDLDLDKFYPSGGPAAGQMAEYNGQLYVARNSLRYWDGSAWNLLSNTTGVNSIAALGGYLYALSTSTSIGGVTCPSRAARWDGSTWAAVGSNAVTSSGALVAFSGALYRRGEILYDDPDDDPDEGAVLTECILTSTGGDWTPLLTNVVITNLWAGDGEIIATGNTDEVGTYTHAGAWRSTGGAFTTLGPSLGGSSTANTVLSRGLRYGGNAWCARSDTAGDGIGRLYELVGGSWTLRATVTHTTLAATIVALEIGADGLLYIGGQWDSGPATAFHHMSYNGSTFGEVNNITGAQDIVTAIYQSAGVTVTAI